MIEESQETTYTIKVTCNVCNYAKTMASFNSYNDVRSKFHRDGWYLKADLCLCDECAEDATTTPPPSEEM